MTRQTKFLIVTAFTFCRLPLMTLFVIGALIHTYHREGWIFVASFTIMVVAALSDLVDGILARKWKVTTELGAYADPLMDKVFYAFTLPIIVYVAARNGHRLHAEILVVFAVTFLLRDQWVSFLRSIGSLHGIDAKANWSGKWRTLLSFPIICTAYFLEESPVLVVDYPLMYTLEAVGLIINAISIYVYTKSFWPALKIASKLGD